jgi:hypothetical protein
MLKASALALMIAVATTVASGQAKKPAGNTTTYDITITAEGTPYTGTMDLTVKGGKVSGTMHIKEPTEITGKAAGTVKNGEMALDFPYHMVQRKCDGQIAMNFKLQPKAAPSKGTVAIVGCGRDASNKLPGTIDLAPVKK